MSANCATREVYTVQVDSVCSSFPSGTSNSQFQVILPIPLRNVVKAELLMASLQPSNNTYVATHLYVEELVSNFTTRATLNYTIRGSAAYSPINTSSTSNAYSNVIMTSTGPAASALPVNTAYLERSFTVIPMDTAAFLNGVPSRFVWTSGNSFPTDVTYINPIRQLKTLTVTLYDKDGAVQTMNGPTFLTWRFECAKDNVCLY